MSIASVPVLARGAAAGLIACVVQVVVGKAEDLLFLPPHEDTHFAPRLVDRLGEDLGLHPSESAEWVLGSLFHVGYAAFWGAAYGVTRERWPVRPVLGGTLLGGLIYGITFTRWGAAVQTQTERPPEQRTARMTAVAASVGLTFGIVTALMYERLR